MANTRNDVQSSLNDLFTFSNFVKKFPNLFDGDTPEQKRKALYWQLYCEQDNGLAAFGAVVGEGRRKRVSASRYLQWWVSDEPTLK